MRSACDPVVYTWPRRALERAGRSCPGQPASSDHCSCGHPTWQLAGAAMGVLGDLSSDLAPAGCLSRGHRTAGGPRDPRYERSTTCCGSIGTWAGLPTSIGRPGTSPCSGPPTSLHGPRAARRAVAPTRRSSAARCSSDQGSPEARNPTPHRPEKSRAHFLGPRLGTLSMPQWRPRCNVRGVGWRSLNAAFCWSAHRTTADASRRGLLFPA